MNNKPITVIVNEVKTQIADIVNKSGLMPILLEPIFREFYQNIVALVQEQTEKERAQYEQQQKAALEKDG